MFGVVALAKAENSVNLLDLQSVKRTQVYLYQKLVLSWFTGTDGETAFTILAMT